MKAIIIMLCTLGLCSVTRAQSSDTIYIGPKDINTSVLIPGTHRWLVYFKMGVDSPRTLFSTWTRSINKIQYEGQPAYEIKQLWEDKDSVSHTTRSVSAAKDFKTLYHESWWRNRGSSRFDFTNQKAFLNEREINDADTATRAKNTYRAFDSALHQFTLNWHLDLEVFPLLPYREHTTFMINFYDPGFSAPKWTAYTVTGSALLKGFDNQDIPCWLLEHNSNNNREVFWISKKTKEVLKLEQQFGKRFRYKIKMPFSV